MRIIVLIPVFALLCSCNSETEKASNNDTFETSGSLSLSEDMGDLPARYKAQQDSISSQFDPQTGANKPLENWIKANMLDAKSYKHIKTEYEDFWGNLKVTTHFWGADINKESVENIVIAEISYSGEIIRMLDE